MHKKQYETKKLLQTVQITFRLSQHLGANTAGSLKQSIGMVLLNRSTMQSYDWAKRSTTRPISFSGYSVQILAVEEPWHELQAPLLIAEFMYFTFPALPVTQTYTAEPKFIELLV